MAESYSDFEAQELVRETDQEIFRDALDVEPSRCHAG